MNIIIIIINEQINNVIILFNRILREFRPLELSSFCVSCK